MTPPLSNDPNDMEPVVLRSSTIRRLTPIVRLMGGGLDAVINRMLDELSEGELLLDTWESDNGVRIAMTFKGVKVYGWYQGDGVVEISDGSELIDQRFGSPSEAAGAVANIINGTDNASLNGNLYWKVERTGEPLGVWLKNNPYR